MKALYTTAPGVYGLVERPIPSPRADEVVVRVARAALCHTDVNIRSGAASHVRYPVIPGHEFSGVLEVCGVDVVGLRAGDRVAVHTILACGHCPACVTGDTPGCHHYDELGSKSDGGFAEFCVVPARHVYPIPPELSLAEAALAEPLANAVSAARAAGVTSGARVVIIGPGPIGLLAVQVVALAKPSLLVLVGTDDQRLALGATLGATATVNIARTGAHDRLHELLPDGADAVLECAGTASAVQAALELVGWRGRIALEGTTMSKVPIVPYDLIVRGASMIGVCGWTSADFRHALDLLMAGQVAARPLISHTFAIEDWEEAFDLVTAKPAGVIKVQLVLDERAA